MNRILQPRPLVVLGLNVWMGTAAGADELVADARQVPDAHCNVQLFFLFREDLRTAHAFAKLQRGHSFHSTYTRLLVYEPECTALLDSRGCNADTAQCHFPTSSYFMHP